MYTVTQKTVHNCLLEFCKFPRISDGKEAKIMRGAFIIYVM